MKIKDVNHLEVASNLAIYNGYVLFIDPAGTVNLLRPENNELLKIGIKAFMAAEKPDNRVFVFQHYLCICTRKSLNIYSLKENTLQYSYEAAGLFVLESAQEVDGLIYMEDFNEEESVLDMVTMNSGYFSQMILGPLQIIRKSGEFLVFIGTKTPGVLQTISLINNLKSSINLSVLSKFEDFFGEEKFGRIQKVYILNESRIIIIQMYAFYLFAVAMNAIAEIRWKVKLEERVTGESVCTDSFIYHYTGTYCYKIKIDSGEIVKKIKLSSGDILKGMGTLKRIAGNNDKSLLLTTGTGNFNVVDNETGEVINNISVNSLFSYDASVIKSGGGYYINDLEGKLFCIELDF